MVCEMVVAKDRVGVDVIGGRVRWIFAHARKIIVAAIVESPFLCSQISLFDFLSLLHTWTSSLLAHHGRAGVCVPLAGSAAA